MTDFSPGTQITHEDFVLFSITLRLKLSVTAKTIKRYITEAYKAIQAAGHNITHPRTCGIFSIIQGLPIPKGRKCRRGLDYCGIQWQHIRLWRKELEYPTQQDMVAITIISIAFTSLRRVGTFLPASLRLEKDFSWIIPKFVRYFDDTETMLIWIPKNKTDPEGKGKVITLKPTRDSCCPVRLVLQLLQRSQPDIPLFVTSMWTPLQGWLLRWVRRRMTNLGKNPRIFGLRSIRQGATTTADATDMPEVFLRASGDWKGRAMERYRKDRLPEAQEMFAARLGNEVGGEEEEHGPHQLSEYAGNPRSGLFGQTGSYGGLTGRISSPPYSPTSNERPRGV